MFSRHIAITTSVAGISALCFALGVVHSRRSTDAERASYDARIDALRAEFQHALAQEARSGGGATATSGLVSELTAPAQTSGDPTRSAHDRIISEVKEQLQREMGLLPVSLLRERRSSFVQLYAYDNHGQESYGTAGYLGQGYFVTVKHAVVALKDDRAPADRSIERITVVVDGKKIPAKLVDAGDANVEVHRGDWAIIKTRVLDLPPLVVDSSFAYEFADPIFRLGNDYSKGIVVSTGYIGQRTQNGLVTCLVDGHPGVSGGGVLDQRGVLVGIPIGRMQGDYRFSFILPIRAEMLRKVPTVVKPPVNEVGPQLPPTRQVAQVN